MFFSFNSFGVKITLKERSPYPTLGKGKSLAKVPAGMGCVSSQEGKLKNLFLENNFVELQNELPRFPLLSANM